MYKTPKEKQSKNKRAEELLGRRPSGTSLFFPVELGYACPICGTKAFDTVLHWSEYRDFLWCDNCNLDIPSCLCKKYPSPRFRGARVLSKRDRVIEQTRIFLDTVEDVKKVARPSYECH